MFHSYPGGCRVHKLVSWFCFFLPTALAKPALAIHFLGHLFLTFVTCNPFLSRNIFAMQPALHQKSHNFTSPPNKIEISPCFPIYTYTILYPITLKQNKHHAKKRKEQNCSQKIGAKLLWPPSHSFNSATWRDFIHGVTWWTDQLVDFLLQRNLLFWNSFSL